MPNKRNKNQQRRRRFNRRKPRNRRRNAPSTPGGPSPMQDAMVRTPLFPASTRRRGQLYYENALGFTLAVSGNVSTYFFTANGMYDPNVTGTGHQPLGFDQMMLMYEQCTVINSSIQVTFITGAGLAAKLGVALFPDVSGLTDPKQLVENGLIRFIPITSGATSIQNQIPRTTVRLGCDVARYFGRRGVRNLLDDDNLYTTAAANPVEQVYYGIVGWQLNPDGSTTTTVGFDVLISYDVIYWEPKKLTES